MQTCANCEYCEKSLKDYWCRSLTGYTNGVEEENRCFHYKKKEVKDGLETTRKPNRRSLNSQ